MFAESQQRASQICGSLLVARSNESEFVCWNVGVGNQFCPVDFHDSAKPVTTLAGSIRGVKGKGARLQWRHVYPTDHASHAFRIKLLLSVNYGDKNCASSQLQCCADRLSQSFASFSSSFLNSPFRPRTMGARTITRSPSGRLRTFCTICSTLCRVMAAPQTWQCGTPIEENRRRM